MPYRIGTALDRNPARLKVLAKRNRKTSRRKRIYSASLFSTIFLGLAWAANQMLI